MNLSKVDLSLVSHPLRDFLTVYRLLSIVYHTSSIIYRVSIRDTIRVFLIFWGAKASVVQASRLIFLFLTYTQ